MPEKDTSPDDAPQTHHVNIATDDNKPTTILLTTVADLKGIDVTELSPLYSCVNGLIEHLFDTPPPGEADAVLTFTYENFRITLYQNGLAVLRFPENPRQSPLENNTPPE